MTDIVERLRYRKQVLTEDGKVRRSWAATELDLEAADEIERLRKIGLELLDAIEEENPLAYPQTIHHAKRILNLAEGDCPRCHHRMEDPQ